MSGGSNNQLFGWNAHRHQASPIAQPRYRFQDVEKCPKSMVGSVVQEVPNSRESFKEIMAEMVLLCTEAVKRNRSGRTASKPLSLEYIADRLDVDDPCFGYIVRSKVGHLQGFITVTTFTNWQSTFSWDSLQEMSFYYDDALDDADINNASPSRQDLDNHSVSGPNSIGEANGSANSPKAKVQRPESGFKTPTKPSTKRKRRNRVIDKDGSLAKELGKTVHLGDPYNEGIVWPRIAEISLLGALGCGQVLVKLVIEQLEFQRASATANYDYIVLQATDNSIPFYESLGFVRVGAVCYDTKHDGIGDNGSDKSLSSSQKGTEAFGTTKEKNQTKMLSENNGIGLAMPKTIVASPNFVFEVVRPGDSPNDVAKYFKVSVWDIIFLNKDIYPDLRPTSRLHKGTQLYIPKIHDEKIGQSNGVDKAQDRSTSVSETPTKWFVAKENDTPRKIAKHFGIPCNKLVSGNQRRLPELQATSRLRAGTRVKVSNLDQHDKICQPYCHWSFPEDTAVEGGDPSYLMVYKLDRKTARNQRMVRDSLGVPVGKYTPPKLLFPPPPKHENNSRTSSELEIEVQSPYLRQSPTRLKKIARGEKKCKFPKRPKRPEELKTMPPESGKDIYWDHQKELHPEFVKSTPDKEKIIRDRWSRLGTHKKIRYHEVAAEARKIYKRIEHKYKGELSRWKKECDRIRAECQLEIEQKQVEVPVLKGKENSMFNKVIKLRDDALEGKDYKYWFVLTYIPDLKWCHLAPMVQEGYFGPDRKRSYGRPRFRLVDEKLGRELDISSVYCIPVKSKALKRTVDADKEEWDIIDGPVTLVKDEAPIDIATGSLPSVANNVIDTTQKTLSKQPKFRSRSPVKPLNGKFAIRYHTQDPLRRTRGSPESRKSRVEEISVAERAVADAKMASTVRRRQRRRCMRCIENGAPSNMAMECLGAKGRFGRDACEHFDENGNSLKEFPKSGRDGLDSQSEDPPNLTKVIVQEQIEVALAPSLPSRPSRRPDSTLIPSSKPHGWSSPAKNTSRTKHRLLTTDDDKKENALSNDENTSRKSRRLR